MGASVQGAVINSSVLDVIESVLFTNGFIGLQFALSDYL